MVLPVPKPLVLFPARHLRKTYALTDTIVMITSGCLLCYGRYPTLVYVFQFSSKLFRTYLVVGMATVPNEFIYLWCQLHLFVFCLGYPNNGQSIQTLCQNVLYDMVYTWWRYKMTVNISALFGPKKLFPAKHITVFSDNKPSGTCGNCALWKRDILANVCLVLYSLMMIMRTLGTSTRWTRHLTASIMMLRNEGLSFCQICVLPLSALDIVMTTSSRATSDDTISIMTTVSFQWTPFVLWTSIFSLICLIDILHPIYIQVIKAMPDLVTFNMRPYKETCLIQVI